MCVLIDKCWEEAWLSPLYYSLSPTETTSCWSVIPALGSRDRGSDCHKLKASVIHKVPGQPGPYSKTVSKKMGRGVREKRRLSL